ncbi:LuxR C-terminal-related transcriptional regulator [Actinacidiphila yeochonensis]|uniref:LuxR C-terminal-related transcriptional regulator n=1 Tax=Actinacidiphila yeochonensis TaxID=89050 RepID=UPI000568DA37|nr:LuxR C-terminal-related transcriptional regulator [Actinacidiphila yeochonensis]
MLQVLGIADFDERVYRALLARPEGPLRELAAGVGASSGRTRSALGRLIGLGLVRRVAPGAYLPIGPESALTVLLNQRRMESEAALARVRDSIEELAREYRAGRMRGDPGSLIEVLVGREAVNRRVDELTHSVVSHLWVLDRPPYLEWADGAPETNESETAFTHSLLAKGADIRTVYCPQSMDRPGRFETVLRLAALGEQARMLPQLPFKLRVMDRRVALMPLIGEVYDNLVVVHPSGLLDGLIELFEAYWERAQPLLPEAVPGPVPGDKEDRLVARMLMAGLKDQAIGRQLGVSSRTATRRIAAVMERLGADTRFQAGAEAVRRGWI